MRFYEVYSRQFTSARYERAASTQRCQRTSGLLESCNLLRRDNAHACYIACGRKVWSCVLRMLCYIKIFFSVFQLDEEP